MTSLAPSEAELLVQVTGLDIACDQLREIHPEDSLRARVDQPLSDREHAAYGGCRHCVTMIEEGKAPLREAVTNRWVACVPAVLVRSVAEWCARALWLLWLASDKAANAFFSDKGDAPQSEEHRQLGKILARCAEHERRTSDNRHFLGKYGTGAQLRKLNRYVHGNKDEMRSGFSADAVLQEFSNENISDMTLAFGGALFIAHRNIARIEGVDDERLMRIRRQRDAFYDLFPDPFPSP